MNLEELHRTKHLRRYARQSDFLVKEFARLCDMPLRKFSEAFDREIGCTPKYYLKMERAIYAADLLRSGKDIVEVVDEVGYSSQSRLNDDLKEFCKTTPKHLKKAWDMANEERKKGLQLTQIREQAKENSNNQYALMAIIEDLLEMLEKKKPGRPKS